MQLSIHLHQELGLRKEEAAKLIPSVDIKKECADLKASWIKGRKARSIPIATAVQKALLKDINSQVDQAVSLIPSSVDCGQYKSHRNHYLTKAYIQLAHGLRHHYAQQ